MADTTGPNEHREETSLVRLLLVVTMVTGAVDAVSILRLGHVFVANMTGNVAFLGFAVAGAPGFSVSASLVALGAFLVGAFFGGRMPKRSPRGMLSRITALEAMMVGAASVVSVTAHGTGARYTMTVLLAAAMGGQNATARELGVADMTTTVLTMTLTGLAADKPDLTKGGTHSQRRVAAVVSMLAGALAGALLVLNTSTGWALGTAGILLASVAAAARLLDP